MRILIVQTSFLGDVILSTPVIAALKQAYPQAKIWFMTRPGAKELLQRDPLLEDVFVFDKHGAERGLLGICRKAKELRGYGFTHAYALSRSFRTSLLMLLSGIARRIGFRQAWLSGLAYHVRCSRDSSQHEILRNLAILSEHSLSKVVLPEVPPKLRLYCSAWEELSQSLRADLNPGQFVILVPASAKATKMWYWERYHEVAQYYSKLGNKVIVLGSSQELDLCGKVAQSSVAGKGGVINLAGRTSLFEAMTLIKHAKLVLCNDSMTQHMAAAFEVPNVVIFCATSPELGFGPWQSRALVVEKQGLCCKPCSRHGGPTCPTGTQACMRELGSSEVIRAAQELLAKHFIVESDDNQIHRT